MAGDLVTWSDYAGLAQMGNDSVNSLQGGFMPAGDVDALNKALAAGSDIDNPGAAPGEGFPLRVESLDRTLFNTTYQAKSVKFWRSLYKDPAYNTVEEFNQLESYGSGDAIWVEEGGLPEEDDSTYSRQYTKIKYMGTTRRVTHVMSLVKAAHGNAVAREVTNGTLFLLRQLERALFIGDDTLIPTQFDGLEKLVVSAFASDRAEDDQYLGYEDELVIDMRGQPLSEDAITDSVELVNREPNYGEASDLWSTTGVHKDLSKILYPKERYDLPAPKGGVAGISIESIRTPFGDIRLNPDIFIPSSKIPIAAGIGKASKRPMAPTLGTLTSPAYAGSNQTYFASDDEGDYFYKVVAGSRFGQSPPAVSAAVTVSANDQVSIPVTDNGPDTTYFAVYRSEKDGAASGARLIARYRRTAAAQTLVDLNRFLPGADKAYLLSQNAEVLKWKQLAPFTKINLATIDLSIRWMQVLYGALQVMKPRHNLVFINVGRLRTGIEA